MRERGLTIVAISGILLGLLVDPLVIASAGTRGYFPCLVIRFFEPCPDDDGEAVEGRTGPAAGESPTPAERAAPEAESAPTESIWAEAGRSADGRGVVYLPPRPVREFLEAPTAERAEAYLAWNRQRLETIARAAEVLNAVAAGQLARSAAPTGTTPAPAACVAPAGSGLPGESRSPEAPPRPVIPSTGDRRAGGPGVAVVYAFASWCPHSTRQAPIVAAWARSRPDLPVVGLLFDSPPGAEGQFDALPFPVRAGGPTLREQLGIRSYPTIVFLKDGVPVEAVSGVTPAARLETVARALGA